jgi:S-adenosylmethionine synthetase
MTNTFTSSPAYLLTSESVTEGHPDKICDQISDAVLDAILGNDPYGRVACETAVTNGLIIVMGEITTDCYVEIPQVVRRVVHDIGYTRPEYGFDYRSCGVMVSINEQSHDIALGVDKSLEAKTSRASDNLDQIMRSHKLCRRLAQVRKEHVLPYLRPDGKSQVTVEYHNGKPHRLTNVVIGAQHNRDISHEKIEKDIIENVIKPVVPASLVGDQIKYYINATGRFVIGGPVSDTGFTGRKILVDTYGGLARHGGGAFSGKDPTKVDRSAAYAARYIAKNIVAAGLAERLEVQIAYVIGVAHPLSISIETFGTARVETEIITGLINKHFDLRPAAIIRDLNLRRPIYQQTACYGHFGRDDLDLPWEKTDKAETLKKEALG